MGKLTKKDFVKFAMGLSQIEDDIVRKSMMKSQISILRETNPKFDEVRFEKYVEDKLFERRMGFKKR